MICRLALAALLVAIALPAQAHTTDELEAWQTDWMERVTAQRALNVGLTAEYIDMVDRHLWYFHPEPARAPAEPTAASQPRAPSRAIGSGAEQWRDLVAVYFPAAEVDRALCIIEHESRGDPGATNPSSGAAGLFQVMPFWWDHYGGDRYDPATNVATARKVWDQQGWWGWSPYKRGLCQ